MSQPNNSIGSGIGEKPENFVFFNPKNNDYSRPIKRGQGWKFITSICREGRLRGNFGTHSMRKTWGIMLA